MDLIPVAWKTGVSIHFLGVFEKIQTQRCVLVLNNKSITTGTGFPRPGLLFSPLVSKFKPKNIIIRSGTQGLDTQFFPLFVVYKMQSI